MSKVHGIILVAVIVMPILSIGIESTAEAAGYRDISKMTPDYTITYDGSDLVTVNQTGSTVIRIANTSSSDILQATFDLVAVENPSTVSNIKVVNASYLVHTPTTIKSPVNLYSVRGTVYTFAPQPAGNRGMLNTIAKVQIQGGIFDCNKASQTYPYIHGLIIDNGSDYSVVKGVQVKNCGSATSGHGIGIVLKAAYSVVTASKSYDNDGDGVYLKSCESCVVQKSWFLRNGLNGIDVSDQDHKMAGRALIFNNTANSNHNGVNLDSTFYNVVANNTLNDNWRGVAEWHGTDNNLHNEIRDNTITHSSVKGIMEQGAISGNPYYSDYSYIHDNTIIISYVPNALAVAGPNSIVENNTVIKG